MGVWPHDAPDEPEEVTIRVESGRVVAINGEAVTPLQAMRRANEIGGRNGIWMKNALENRIIGTKSRGVYEAPGMELLGFAIRAVYQATICRRGSAVFHHLSRVIAEDIYDGRLFEPAAQGALAGIDHITKFGTGTVGLRLYKGNVYFSSLTEVPHSLYNEADSSMEASDGLNPASSQGYLEVQRVAAHAMARAGQIEDRIRG